MSAAGAIVGYGQIQILPTLHPRAGIMFRQQLGTVGNLGTQQGQQIGRNIGNGAQQASSRVGGIGRGLGRALIAGFAAAGIAKGISKVVTTGLDEVKDYQKGYAQLQQGLKSTGNVAGLTADQMEDLASSIEGYSGQTDDSIVATEQLLLTFTNIKNTAGAGNDVFTQTTKIAADMAARLGGDASGAAVQLGKALNDPVKGVTALSRVGVSFDAQQKQQIKTFVDSGNVMGAQKIILAELTKEFGGSAKAVGDTLPGQIERGKRAFEGFAQSIVGSVIPPLASAAAWLGPKLATAITAGTGAIGKAVGVVKGVVSTGLSDVAAGFQNPQATIGPGVGRTEGLFLQLGAVGRKAFDGLISAGQRLGAGIQPGLQAVSQSITTSLLPSLRNLGTFGGTFLEPLRDAARLLAPLAPVVGVLLVGAFNAFGAVLRDVIGPALSAITGFMDQHRVAITAAAIVIGGLFVPALLAAAGSLAIDAAATIFMVVWTRLYAAGTKIAAAAQWLWNAAMNANPIGLVVGLIIGLVAAIIYAYTHSETFRQIVQAAWQGIQAAASYAWNNVLKPIFGFLQVAWGVVGTLFSFVWNYAIKPIWSLWVLEVRILWAVLGVVFNLLKVAWSVVGTLFSFVWNYAIKPIWSLWVLEVRLLWAVLQVIFRAISFAWGVVGSGLSWVYDHVISPMFSGFHRALDLLKSAFSSTVDGIKTVWGKLKGIFSGPVNLVFDIIGGFDHAVNWVLDKIGLGKPLPERNQLPKYAKGGQAQPGWALVGEEGPELVNFSQPGRVYTAGQSDKLMGAGVGYGVTNPGGPQGGPSFKGFVKSVVGTPSKIAHGAGKAISSIGDAAQWVFEEGTGLLRQGAADALAATYRKIADPLLGRLPKNLVGDMGRSGVETVATKVIDFIRGKEAAEVYGDYTGPLGGAIGAIIEVMRRSGIPFGVNSTLRPGDPGFHGSGNAVDFGGPLERIAAYWAGLGGNLLELIYGNGWQHNFKNGKDVGDGLGVYGAATIAQHGGGNAHVHVAATLAAMQRVLGIGAGGPAGESGGYNVAAEKAYARSRMAAYGLNPGGFSLLDFIWTQESGWNPFARNSSGALGIPQALGHGNVFAPGDWRRQIDWGENYIHQRYGSIEAAYAYKRRTGVYDTGGIFPNGSIGINTSGRDERVLTGRQNDAFEALVGHVTSGGGLGAGPAMHVDTLNVLDRPDTDHLAQKVQAAQEKAMRGFGR